MYMRILRHSFRTVVDLSDEEDFITATSYLMSVMLKLSYEDPSKREKLFSLLFLSLVGDTGRYFANKAQKCPKRLKFCPRQIS